MPSVAPRPVAHYFTVDVEEHFQVSAFDGVVGRSNWERHPSRVDGSVEALLDLLDRHDARGTFFTLGWLAERRPAMVRRIAERGHEVASHGFWHRRVTTLSPGEFRDDVRDAKASLEDAAGVEVTGFRAPNFSILPGFEWAFDVLLEEGYRYDSSLFPIRRPGYGYPGAPREPHALHRASGTLWEYPLATLDLFGFRVPAAGGGYLRQFPPAVIRHAFRRLEASGVPGVFYIHPWEVDPGQPRIPVGRLTQIRHYRGLDQALPRMDRLLSEFRFTSIAERGVPSAVPA